MALKQRGIDQEEAKPRLVATGADGKKTSLSNFCLLRRTGAAADDAGSFVGVVAVHVGSHDPSLTAGARASGPA